MDASAIVDLFRGHEAINELFIEAGEGRLRLLLPTTAIADAESQLAAGTNGWEAILRTPGVESLDLTQHAAIEIGTWPGSLSCRHAVHEAHASGASVLTRDPRPYLGLRVPLDVV
jgi:hypothetical protein